MLRGIVISLIATIISLAVALLILKYFTPSLLGLPVDAKLVQISQKIPPFLASVFRSEDRRTTDFLINDPVLKVRGKPLLPEIMGIGPNDLLGFRNYSVPRCTDILTIGDSHTYGNNARIETNWPSTLKNLLVDKKVKLYNASVGSWSAPQYLETLSRLVVFEPRLVVMAFYSGNDAYEAFQLVYASKYWEKLRPDKNANLADLPVLKFPPPASEIWRVKIKNNEIAFSPKHRLLSNLADNKAIQLGYQIIAQTLKDAAELAKRYNFELVWTVLPTKELAYSDYLKTNHLSLTGDYQELVVSENKYIENLISEAAPLSLTYVDIVSALRSEIATGNLSLYPEVLDGHPTETGYAFIAEIISKKIKELLPTPLPIGKYKVKIQDDQYMYYEYSGEKLNWTTAPIPSPDSYKEVHFRELSCL